MVPLHEDLKKEIIQEILSYEENLVAKVRKAVVGIQAGGGYGSGSHIGDGYILTNDHVVQRNRRVNLEWPINEGRDKLRSVGKVLFQKEDYDLAIVRDENSLNYERPKLFLREEGVGQGTKVCVIGSPLTLFNTTTFGHVTSTYRELDYYGSGGIMAAVFFQTDAAINPGNSGGACVDYDGNLIGVPSAGYTGADNIGFVIKARSVLDFVQKFQRNRSLELALLRAFVS